MNRNGFRDKSCWGVDLNRNFSYGYGRKHNFSLDEHNLFFKMIAFS